MDIMQEVIDFVTETIYEDLSAEVVHAPLRNVFKAGVAGK